MLNPALFRDEFLTPLDNLFDEMLTEAFPSFTKDLGVGFIGKASYPKVDVLDLTDKVTIEAEIPGLSNDDVSVDLEDNILTISGKKRAQDTDTSAVYIRRELKKSSFKRSFTLSDTLLFDKIKANFENGLLKVTIPKKQAKKPKSRKIL